MADDTKLVRVEGKIIRVPSDASPDEIDAISKQGEHTAPIAKGSFQMHKEGPIISPADIQAMAHASTGIGSTPPLGTTPIEARMLGAEAGKQVTPADVSRETGFDALLAPLSLVSGYGTGNPIATAKSLIGSVLGGAGGAALGKYVAGEPGKYVGGLAGGLYGGYRGAKGAAPIPESLGAMPSKFGVLSRLGRALGTFSEEEPSVRPGAAREMAGGTAAETGTGVSGGQAGPSAGPKNASELSSTVQRVRSGTAASPIVSLEEAAKQGGTASAAGGGPAWLSQAITPSQLSILQKLKARGINLPIPGSEP